MSSWSYILEMLYWRELANEFYLALGMDEDRVWDRKAWRRKMYGRREKGEAWMDFIGGGSRGDSSLISRGDFEMVVAFASPAVGNLARAAGSLRGARQARFCRTAMSVRDGKKKVVFLGSPLFAANSLRKIKAESEKIGFELSMVITQPAQPAGRKRILTPTPVQVAAEELGIEVRSPAKASEQEFLKELEEMQPDLCITAAYGNFLPTKFLRIPVHGTVNIHPSLLPAFRGAAPVPRALEAGVDTAGVTVMFTVLEMDAGPIISQCELPLKGDEKAPELLDTLFDMGTEEIIRLMPGIFKNEVQSVEQDHANATHAAKMSKDEGTTAFTENARRIHNKVRAFSGWPAMWTELMILDGKGKEEELRVKLITTRVHRSEGGPALGVHEIDLGAAPDAIRIVCDDGSVLDILELQPQGKKAMSAKQFKVGLQHKSLARKRVPH